MSESGPRDGSIATSSGKGDDPITSPCFTALLLKTAEGQRNIKKKRPILQAKTAL
jgi:hypothetical protein